MNRIRSLVIVLALMAAATLLVSELAGQPAPAQAPAAASPTRLAVCDVMDLLDNFQKARDMMSNLEKQREAVQAEGAAREQNLERMQQVLQGLQPDSPEYTKRLDDAEQAAFELKGWKELQQAKMLREHHRLTNQLYREILQGVGTVARTRGLDLVLYFDRKDPPTRSSPELARVISSKHVLWHDERLDITEDVLSYLNTSYSKAP